MQLSLHGSPHLLHLTTLLCDLFTCWSFKISKNDVGAAITVRQLGLKVILQSYMN